MSNAAPSRHLSPIDAAFLFLERKEIPLNIASVCIFDGPIPFDAFVGNIRAKLALVPRYQQIPVMQPWGFDLPTWEDDPSFDIREHIFPITLEAPGGEAELQALAGRILSQRLDRSKPLWDIHVVKGLKDGRGALIWRVHHALADGVSGVELMKIMLDPTPEAAPVAPAPRQRAKRASEKPRTLADGISSAVNTALGNVFGFERGLLEFAHVFLGERREAALKGLVEVLPEFAASIERLPFNKPCTGERKFCWAEFSMADVQKVRDAGGSTFNDVILAALTRALSQYVKLHGQSVNNRLVRIVCPVNLRQNEDKDGLGNQISFLPVALPMDARGPMRTLQAISKRTAALKRSGAAGLVGLAAKWLASTPPPIQEAFWRSIPEIILPVPLLNLICTNVAGSPTALYAAGRRMLAAYPQVPTGWDLGVGCAVHSYDGKVFFGIIADTHAAPDVEQLRDLVVESFRELCRSAALKKARSSVNRSKDRSLQNVERSGCEPTAEPADAARTTPEPTNRVAVSAGTAEAAVGHTKEAA